MNDAFPAKAREIMNARFGRDTVIALATVDGNIPSVRAVNAYYEDKAFYIVTYALSCKMKQLQKKPQCRIVRRLVHRARHSGQFRLVLQRRKPSNRGKAEKSFQ